MKQFDFWNGETAAVKKSRVGRPRIRDKAYKLEYQRNYERERRKRDPLYYEKHRERYKEIFARYYQKNREKIKERHIAWRKANPEKVAIYKKRRNAKQNTDPALRARRKAYYKAYKAANAERLAAKARAYRLVHRDEILARERARALANRDRDKDRDLKKTYGISLEQWNKMFRAQGRKCAICRTSKFGAKGPLVDHCHGAGHVRGLLCNKCNVMIGLARNSARITAGALKYLTKEVIFNQNGP